MDDEQIKALFKRKRDLEERLGDSIVDVDWKVASSYEIDKLLANLAEELIIEGWIDLKLPQKAIINQFNHPPGVRSADQV